MIIECKSCHARFRLDESKIKGRGARVKCRKCGEPIVVLKDAGTGIAAQEPGGEGSLDLGSALRESSAAGAPAPGPHPPDNLIPFPGPTRIPEPPATGKDEVDLAFEQLLSGTAEAPAEEPPAPEAPPIPAWEDAGETREEFPSGPTFEPPPEAAEEPSVTEAPPPAPTAGETAAWAAGEGSLEFAPEEKFELPPLGPEEPVMEEATPPPMDAGFLIGDAETVSFLQEEAEGEKTAEPVRDDDISLSIAAKPVELEPSLPLESTAFPASQEAAAAPASEAISLEGNVTPPPVPRETDVPPHREEEPGPAAPPPAPLSYRERGATPEPARSSPSFRRIAGIVLLIALLSAVGFFGFTESGKRIAAGVTPRISALLEGERSGKTAPRFELRNVIGNELSGAASPRILVIRGELVNRSSMGKSGLRVTAALLDNTDKVLLEQTVYAGNVLSPAKLKSGDRATLEKALANPLGEHLSNMDVPPGGTVPFMVLFFDAPEEMVSYRVEAGDTR